MLFIDIVIDCTCSYVCDNGIGCYADGRTMRVVHDRTIHWSQDSNYVVRYAIMICSSCFFFGQFVRQRIQQKAK